MDLEEMAREVKIRFGELEQAGCYFAITYLNGKRDIKPRIGSLEVLLIPESQTVLLFAEKRFQKEGYYLSYTSNDDNVEYTEDGEADYKFKLKNGWTYWAFDNLSAMDPEIRRLVEEHGTVKIKLTRKNNNHYQEGWVN